MKTLRNNEKLSAIMAVSESNIQASMLYKAALDAATTPSVFTRLLESEKMEVLTDNVLAISIDYFLKHGLLNTLKQIYTKLTNMTEPNESSTIWDNSSEQYTRGGFKLYWEMLEKIREYQLSFTTGRINEGYDTYCINILKQQTNGQNLKGLVLGCHESEDSPEMCFYQSGMFESLEVMDIAQELVDRQRAKVAHKGINSIEYKVADLNHEKLKPDTYDLIWSAGTIHHIQNLEHLFTQIEQALTSTGVFFTRDYVGPSMLQFTDYQLSIVNGLLALLPDRYKKTMYGRTIKRARRPSLAKLKKSDPSEAVRSADIVRVMSEHLKIVRLSQTGGTILHPLLNKIASNFEMDSSGEALLEMLINFERSLVKDQIIPSDYISCLAEKKA